MIDTKFKNTDPKTSLQALWLEVVKEDKFRTIEIAGLRAKAEALEKIVLGLQIARRVAKEEVYPDFRRRLENLENNSNLTTPEKKTLWERITGK